MRKVLIFLFMGIVLMSLGSANGLTLVNDTFTINKTRAEDAKISLTLKNEEGFKFLNISLEDNDVLTIPKIDELESGDEITFDATIKKDSSIDRQFRIRGLFEGDIGQGEEQNHEVRITFDPELLQYQIDKCTLNIARGDSVTFINNADTSLILINSDNGNPISELEVGENHTREFNSEVTLNYRFFVGAFGAGPQCRVTASGTGLINDPNLDALLNLQVNLQSAPTSLSTFVSRTEYTIPLSEEREGTITIENTGSALAENIRLSGDWFVEFSSNNFNLNPGQTKGVVFKIRPSGIDNNENQSYIRTLKVEGNFDIQEIDFNVSVPSQASVDGEQNELGRALREFLEFCRDNPEDTLCDLNNTETIFVNNASEAEFNLSVKEKELQEFGRNERKQTDLITDLSNIFKTTTESQSQDISQIKQDNNLTKEELRQIKENNQGLWDTLWFFVGLLTFIALAIAGGWWYFTKYQDSKMEEQSRF